MLLWHGKSEDYRYPSYFDAVINEAVNDYGLTEEETVNNGYRIHPSCEPQAPAWQCLSLPQQKMAIL